MTPFRAFKYRLEARKIDKMRQYDQYNDYYIKFYEFRKDCFILKTK